MMVRPTSKTGTAELPDVAIFVKWSKAVMIAGYRHHVATSKPSVRSRAGKHSARKHRRVLQHLDIGAIKTSRRIHLIIAFGLSTKR